MNPLKSIGGTIIGGFVLAIIIMLVTKGNHMVAGVSANAIIIWLHVLSGIVLILNVWWLGRKGHYSAERHWGVEATAIYWHYVDLVWIFLLPLFYLTN